MKKISFVVLPLLSWACNGEGKECPWGGDENGCFSCFVAGTRILTPDGHQLIEQLQEGEAVLSWDTDNNCAVVRNIKSLIRGTANQIFRIWVGESCIQGVTDEHPFYCPMQKEWRKAGELREGDMLLLRSNGEKKIQGIHRIERVQLKEAVAIYNLSVEGPEHNYFAEEVLVHNKTPAYDYPSECEACSGYCYVSDNWDLMELSECNRFDGTIYIESDLESLASMVQLESITGDLFITENPSLTNLSGLSALQTVGGTLSISSNASLTSLDGLSNITEISDDLLIFDNDSLTNVNGLNNLSMVRGSLHIDSNDSLLSIDELHNLSALEDYLSISSNASLTSLDGLSNITEISGDLLIFDNDSLTNLNGLNNLTIVRGSLHIDSNDSLLSIDELHNLSALEDYLSISSNAFLTSLDGLSNITEISGDLLIADNDSLTNVNGLNNLSMVWGSLYIDSNDSLLSIDGLSNLSFVGDNLSISYNVSLCQSLVDEFVEGIGIGNALQDICCNDESC